MRKYYDVRVVESVFSKDHPWDTLKTVLNLIKGVLWADVTFSWYASNDTFLTVQLSKLFNKKSVIVVGGYEVAKVPEIKYGAMLNRFSAFIVKYVLKNADKILAVSEFNRNEILNYTPSKKVILVYNCVDCDRFKPKGKKEDLVITVANISNDRYKLKGLTTYIKTAYYLPNIKFLLIGKALDNAIEDLKSIAPSNVEFLGYMPPDALLKYYQRAKVYCQLSLRESFGVALAEAMACECVPVSTHNAALPEIVGDAGFYVPYDDEKATAEVIERALQSDKGKEASERIKNMFSLEKREKILINEIESVLKRPGTVLSCSCIDHQ